MGPEQEQSREEIVAWVGGQVLPHEADVRAWLKRVAVAPSQIDDVIQDAYCKIAALSNVRHIENGRAYFFTTARNIMLGQMRRSRIVRIDAMTEMEMLRLADSEPSPERAAAGRRDLERIQALIQALPDKCRTIFELRRIQGVSQREIARQLGVTENVVEAQSARGLKLILQALENAEAGHQAPATAAAGEEDENAARR